MEEANLNILYAVGFQLHDILEKAKLWRQENDEWLPGIQGRREGGPGQGKGREREGETGTRSLETTKSRKDGERLEPKHPLPFARAPSPLRSRSSFRVATETQPGEKGGV